MATSDSSIFPIRYLHANSPLQIYHCQTLTVTTHQDPQRIREISPQPPAATSLPDPSPSLTWCARAAR